MQIGQRDISFGNKIDTKTNILISIMGNLTLIHDVRLA